LDVRGYPAVAVDLPNEDPNVTFSDFSRSALDALADADDLVLVGHSLGAYVIPLIAEARPVRTLVALCGAIPPTEGSERLAGEPPMEETGTFDALEQHPDGSSSWPGDGIAATAAMYPDCSAEDAAWAVERLRRQSGGPWRSFQPLSGWPAVPTVSIACREDRLIRFEWATWAAGARLNGSPVIELPGGHSPMVSRPDELATVLAGIASAGSPVDRSATLPPARGRG
jgi:pimeloyl-ACP methyl ester carboxylesterase